MLISTRSQQLHLSIAKQRHVRASAGCLSLIIHHQPLLPTTSGYAQQQRKVVLSIHISRRCNASVMLILLQMLNPYSMQCKASALLANIPANALHTHTPANVHSMLMRCKASALHAHTPANAQSKLHTLIAHHQD